MAEVGNTSEMDFAARLLAKAPEGFLAPVESTDTGESPPSGSDEVATDEATDTPAEEVVETPEGEAGGEASDTETQEEDEGPYLEIDDPTLIAYLQKYDGDVVAALKAAVEAQTLIGRQGSELGDMRSQIEALRVAIEARAAAPQTPAGIPGASFPYIQQVAESNPAAAAEMAYQAGDPFALQYAVDLWKEEDPFSAALFVMEKRSEQSGQKEGTPEAQVAAIPHGYTQSELDSAVNGVVQKHPDINEYLPTIGQIVSEMPLFNRALNEGTPLERAAALETLTVMAKTRQGADTSAQALDRVRIRLKADADDARSDAAVVSATRRAEVQKPSRSDEEILPGFTRGKFRELTGQPPLEDE